MANTDRPHGFSPYGPLLRCRPYGTDGAEIQYIGDAMMVSADGNVNVTTAGALTQLGSNMTYHAATAASATSANPVVISDHTEQLYEAQDDAAAVSALASIGSMVNGTVTTGSTVTFISKQELDADTIGETTNTWQILGLVPRVDNAWGNWADHIVQLNTGEGLLTVAAGI
jgi:hypothetical protein